MRKLFALTVLYGLATLFAFSQNLSFSDSKFARLVVTNPGTADWSLQFRTGGVVPIVTGKYYTVSFKMRSTKTVKVGLTMGTPLVQVLSMVANQNMAFSYTFLSTTTSNANLIWKFGPIAGEDKANYTGEYWIDDILIIENTTAPLLEVPTSKVDVILNNNILGVVVNCPSKVNVYNNIGQLILSSNVQTGANALPFNSGEKFIIVEVAGNNGSNVVKKLMVK